MASEIILYGPDSEAYNAYTVVAPAPGNNGPGGAPAFIHVRPYGTQLVLQDGRKFRFASVGGSTLAAGSVYTGPVNTSSQQALTPAAASVGDKIITMTTGASSAANTFAEGFVNVNVTPGGGQMFKIASHALMTTAAGDVVNLWPGQAIRTALTTTSRIDLLLNTFKGVVIAPATTLAAPVMGVAMTAATTLQGVWLQTRGLTSLLGDGATVVIAGTRVVVGVGSGGGGPETATAATSRLQVTIGIAHFANSATGGWSATYLTIDG